MHSQDLGGDDDGVHQQAADAATLIVVGDDKRHLGDTRVVDVADEARVGHHRFVPRVDENPDEVVDVVDLEQIVHQRGTRSTRRHEAPVERLVGEFHRLVVGAFAVAGQHRTQQQFTAVRERDRDRGDERCQPLADYA